MSLSFLFLVAAMVMLLAALWPFGPYQLSLMVARRLHAFADPVARDDAAGAAAEETFAICLCAYNERAVIRDKVEDLLRLRAAAGGALQILIYVDCANDGTTEILEEYRDRIDLYVSPERHGKTYGMNLLVSRTTASIVMFTDANVLIAPDAVAVLRRYFANPSIGCVCSDLTYVNAGDSETAQVGALYWRLNEWSKSLETSTGSVIGADGSLFAIRRRLHRPVPKGLFDDIYLSLCVLLQHARVVRAPELRAFETHATEPLDEFRRKIRIACECMHVHLTLWPELRRLDAWTLYKYIGHRLLRWVGGYCFLAAALLGIAALWAAAGAGWALGLPVAGLLLLWGSLRAGFGPARMVWNVLLAFLGNAIGVWRALRGKRAVTWNAPQSARRATLAVPVERPSAGAGGTPERMSEAHRREGHRSWRVALLDPADFGPAYDLELAQGLLDGGHCVRLIGKHGFDEAARPAFRTEHFYRGLANPLARRLPRPLFQLAKGVHHAADMARLGGRLARFAPDIVHFLWLPLPLVDTLFVRALRRRMPLVLTMHDSNPYNGATSWLMSAGYVEALRLADAVIVHTGQAEERLAAMGVPMARIHRLPHGLIHAAGPAPTPAPRADGRLRLLQFGKIRPYKGVDVLLDALARLTPGERSRLDVTIMGRPYLDTAPLQAFVRQHGLEATVTFRFEFVDETEMDRQFAQADAALFPYREIDASGVAMTAVARGLPVVASAIGAFREQFQDGREARLVPPGDAGALAGVLRDWVSEPGALARLAEGMRIHRAGVPDWREIARRTTVVYAAARDVWESRKTLRWRAGAQYVPERSVS